jgi:recombinational DNA repair ATPase RecF
MLAIQLEQPFQGTSDTGLEKAMSLSLAFSHWHIAHQQMPIAPIAVINDLVGYLAAT